MVAAAHGAVRERLLLHQRPELAALALHESVVAAASIGSNRVQRRPASVLLLLEIDGDELLTLCEPVRDAHLPRCRVPAVAE